MIYLELFISFLQVGLFSIGGGYAAMPIIQSEVVEGRGWITMSQFSDLVTISEMTPGPIAVNAATFVGNRVAGFGGALAATIGCILPSIIIVSVLSYIYVRFMGSPIFDSVLASLRAVVVALILSAGISILQTAVFTEGIISVETFDLAALLIFVTAFVLLRKFKLSPIPIMAGCGAVYLVINLIAEIV